MNIKDNFLKTLLATSIASIFALATLSAYAQEAEASGSVYAEESEAAPKLLSEMTEEEKAALTPEEMQLLQDIEAQSVETPAYQE